MDECLLQEQNVRTGKGRQRLIPGSMFQHFEFVQFRLLLTAKDFAATSVARIVDPRVYLQVMVVRSDFCKVAFSSDLVSVLLHSKSLFQAILFQISFPKKGSRRRTR